MANESQERNKQPATAQSSPGFQMSSQIGMLLVLGMIGASAGFTMYTKRTGQMLKQFDHIAQQQAKRAPKRPIGPMTKEEWDKVRPRFEKDDFF